ncbi:hypothetical protein [Paraburkholderia sp. HP33-1]|uniref:hypothetical protein n=1 Tax=Paraburkholderia sp. HP33-1 TaxID=2883243 RepID=UPI001F30A245|nr:hypothetical protein [Paraburkholderia sp. HP33-1]
MINTREEIERRLSAIEGLSVSAVHHAAGTLTMQFGTLKPVANFKGAIRYVGEWSLHVQCVWKIEQAGSAVATQDDLFGPDETAHREAQRIDDLLVKQGRAVVKSVSGSEEGGAEILLSGGLRLVITPNSAPDEEDWRFFDPTSNAKHFVIEGGKVDPWSLS